jgi:rubrerythrin
MPALHTLFMQAIAEEQELRISRRRLLGTGTKFAVGGAVAMAAVASPALARLVAAQDFADDIEVLNYALTLEHLEYAFYRDGLANFTAENFWDDVYDNLLDVRDHEGAHVDALVSTIESLGGTPVQEATYEFGYQNPAGFLAVAAALENTGVSAYDGAGAALENPDLLTAAGTIVAVEARHAAYLNLLVDEEPFPAAFETPLTPDEVLAIAGPFIVQ